MMDRDTSTRPIINPWIIAIAVMLSTFLEVLDTSVVNVSLPYIAGGLSATIDQATWVLTSYLVANAIILPITGWLANQFGRKRLLITAVTGFTLASLLCGIAPSLPLLVLFRCLQGAFGGSLQPISQAVLLETFPPQERGKAMAFWGIGVVVAPILGPALGGFLTSTYSWRWVFYINLPIGIAAIIMTQLFIWDPSYIKPRSAHVDGWGLGMLAVGIASLQILLDKGQEADWFSSHLMVVLGVLAVVLLAGFVIWELTTKDPVVHLRVFKDRTYATGVFLMTSLGFVLYGGLVMLPLFMQVLLGYSAITAGLWTAPRGLGALIFMPIVGILMSRKWDSRLLLLIGLVAGSYGPFMFARFNLSTGPWSFFWPQVVQGGGMAFIFVPLTTITMDAIPLKDMGNATALFNLMRNLGGAVGISVVTFLVARRQQFHQNRLTSQLGSTNPTLAHMLAGFKALMMTRGMDAATAARQALAAVYGMVQQQALLLSYVEVFFLLGTVFLLMTPLVLLLRRPKSSRSMAAH
ncbi:MAG: DHA2 family efflux MFS transporter permease subunit [Terriglobales bacterium]